MKASTSTHSLSSSEAGRSGGTVCGDDASEEHSSAKTSSTNCYDALEKPSVSESLTVNELLSYISFYRNKGNIGKIHSVVLTHFSPSNICDAKKMLVSPFRDQFADGSLLTERRSSQT